MLMINCTNNLFIRFCHETSSMRLWLQHILPSVMRGKCSRHVIVIREEHKQLYKHYINQLITCLLIMPLSLFTEYFLFTIFMMIVYILYRCIICEWLSRLVSQMVALRWRMALFSLGRHDKLRPFLYHISLVLRIN